MSWVFFKLRIELSSEYFELVLSWVHLRFPIRNRKNISSAHLSYLLSLHFHDIFIFVIKTKLTAKSILFIQVCVKNETLEISIKVVPCKVQNLVKLVIYHIKSVVTWIAKAWQHHHPGLQSELVDGVLKNSSCTLKIKFGSNQ